MYFRNLKNCPFCNSWSCTRWFLTFLLRLNEFQNWKWFSERLRCNDHFNIAKIGRFVWKRGSFALQKRFLLSITTKGSCWHITIGLRCLLVILNTLNQLILLHTTVLLLKKTCIIALRACYLNIAQWNVFIWSNFNYRWQDIIAFISNINYTF